jgi:signal transduction histidine kinase
VTDRDAARAQVVIEESPEILAILDEEGVVIACSRRARFEGIDPGQPLPARYAGAPSVGVDYLLDGKRERVVYFGIPGNPAAYEELRSGFTAAVSHELRTPLARLLVLLETAELPDAEIPALIDGARAEVEQVRELIDEVLFLSQLESGEEVVSLGSAPTDPVLESVAADFAERAERAGVAIEIRGDATISLPLRERMQRVIVSNFIENAVRYAGTGATVTISVRREGAEAVLMSEDTGAGVPDEDLPRLFERFFRGDRVRSSRGTGLGLAIVKHIVGAAGGQVDATRAPSGGLRIRCRFPADDRLDPPSG